MSGLVRFFQPFLNPHPPSNHNDNNDNDRNEEQIDNSSNQHDQTDTINTEGNINNNTTTTTTTTTNSNNYEPNPKRRKLNESQVDDDDELKSNDKSNTSSNNYSSSNDHGMKYSEEFETSSTFTSINNFHLETQEETKEIEEIEENVSFNDNNNNNSIQNKGRTITTARARSSSSSYQRGDSFYNISLRDMDRRLIIPNENDNNDDDDDIEEIEEIDDNDMNRPKEQSNQIDQEVVPVDPSSTSTSTEKHLPQSQQQNENNNQNNHSTTVTYTIMMPPPPPSSPSSLQPYSSTLTSIQEIPKTPREWKRLTTKDFVSYITSRVLGRDDDDDDDINDNVNECHHHQRENENQQLLLLQELYNKDEIKMLGRYYYYNDDDNDNNNIGMLDTTQKNQQQQQQQQQSHRIKIFKQIPILSNTTQHISTIQNLDIQTTKSLSIPLASIRFIRDIHYIQHFKSQTMKNDHNHEIDNDIKLLQEQMKNLSDLVRDHEKKEKEKNHDHDDNDDDDEILPLLHQYELLKQDIHEKLQESWEVDGPLCQNYNNRAVLCMEVMELDECYLENNVCNDDDDGDQEEVIVLEKDGNDDNGNDNDSEQRRKRKERIEFIHQSASAAFNTQPKKKKKQSHTTSTTTTSTTTATTQTPPSPPRRRIRLFFYDKYAEKISNYIQQQQKQLHTQQTKNSEQNEVLKSNHSFLISLKNIPAICIFPYQMRRNGRAGEALLEHDYGRLASYCICIGGEGKVQDNRNVSSNNSSSTTTTNRRRGRFIPFDSDDMEIRFCSMIDNATDDEIDIENNKNECELVLSKSNINFDQIDLTNDESCTMKKKFDSLMKLYRKEKVRRYRNQLKNTRTTINTVVFTNDSGGANTTVNIANQGALSNNTSITATSTGNQNQQSVNRGESSILSGQGNTSSGAKSFMIDNHQYVPLDHVENIYRRTQGRKSKESEFNFYGIILCYTVPKLTRAGDWMVTITVFDDTINDIDDKEQQGQSISTFSMTLFNKNKDSLPNILCAGDIIRFHRVVPNKWHDELQLATLKWSTHTTVSRHIDQNNNEPWNVQGCQKTRLNMSRVVELWEYGQNLMTKRSTVKNASYRMMIENIETAPETTNNAPNKDFGDMIVMVANVIPFPTALQSSSSPRGFLRAWDGTGPSSSDPIPFGVQSNSNEEPPKEALMAIAKTLNEFNSIQNNESIEPPKKLVGRVINMVVWETNHWRLIENNSEFFSPGKFLRLRNVKKGKLYSPNQDETGPICVHVNVNTLLTKIPDKCFDVIKLLRDHNTKIQNGFPFNPQSGMLPLDHQISKKVLSEENSVSSLPICLQRCDRGIVNNWYDLFSCIRDEKAQGVYPVRFQIMDMMFIPIDEGSSDRHIILDVRDKTFQIPIIVPFDKVSQHTNTLLTNERVFNRVKHQAFSTKIHSCFVNNTKFFVMGDKLKIINAP